MKFKLALSEGYQVITQRLAKGKKVDLFANPVVFRRRLALLPYQLESFFFKDFLTPNEVIILHHHQLTLDRQSGMDPLLKVVYKPECTYSLFEVGRLFAG